MTKDYEFTDEEAGFTIDGACLSINVKDLKRSTTNNAVWMTVIFEIETDSNGGFVLQYKEMDYPGNSIKPRDFDILSDVTEHLSSLGIPVQGVPSTAKQ